MDYFEGERRFLLTEKAQFRGVVRRAGGTVSAFAHEVAPWMKPIDEEELGAMTPEQFDELKALFKPLHDMASHYMTGVAQPVASTRSMIADDLAHRTEDKGAEPVPAPEYHDMAKEHPEGDTLYGQHETGANPPPADVPDDYVNPVIQPHHHDEPEPKAEADRHE